MKPLQISGTSVSPSVNFDPDAKVLELGGYSRPENVRDFYFPIILWLEQYKEFLKGNRLISKGEPISFRFKFIYFNSSSAKFIFDIITMLNEIQREGVPLKIYWYFDEDDDELREAGEELSDMTNVPFYYVEVKKG
jgi:hypothetical protein